MSHTAVLTSSKTDEILSDAVRKQLRIVVTHREDNGWTVFKSQLLGELSPGGLLVVQKLEAREGGRTNLPPVGATLGITLRLGHKKCMFSTVRAATPEGQDPSDVYLERPEHLEFLQRRAYERVSPPGGTVVAVRFWRICDKDGTATRRDVRYGELENLSAGGLSINAGNTADLEPDQTFECLFAPRPGAAPIVAEVTLRHREAGDGQRATLGFQFIGLETTEEGRTLLNRIAQVVRQYQHAPKNKPDRLKAD